LLWLSGPRCEEPREPSRSFGSFVGRVSKRLQCRPRWCLWGGGQASPISFQNGRCLLFCFGCRAHDARGLENRPGASGASWVAIARGYNAGLGGARGMRVKPAQSLSRVAGVLFFALAVGPTLRGAQGTVQELLELPGSRLQEATVQASVVPVGGGGQASPIASQSGRCPVFRFGCRAHDARGPGNRPGASGAFGIAFPRGYNAGLGGALGMRVKPAPSLSRVAGALFFALAVGPTMRGVWIVVVVAF